MGLNVHILCEPEEYPTLKKKIDLHFCALAEWNETDVSHEGTVLSGEDARQRRLELITKAHIVVLVLSPELRSFLNQEVDLYKILIDRMLAGELLILSVMFRRVGKEYWFYKDFKDLGGNLPINQWKDPDDAWYSVEQEYDESVKIYPTLCSRQKIRFEHLKRALAEFNFTRQFKYFESQKMPASAPVFTLFLIQGSLQDGRNLLAHRLRRRLYPETDTYADRINLQSLQASDRIWDHLSAYFPDDESRTPAPHLVLERMAEALETSPKALVIDGVEYDFQLDTLADFFKELDEVGQGVFLRKRPAHSGSIFLMSDKFNWTDQVQAGRLPAGFRTIRVVPLPAIGLVTYDDLVQWVDDQIEAEMLLPVVADKIKDPDLLQESESENAVLPVLERVTNRICGTKDLTEAVYDRYLAELK